MTACSNCLAAEGPLCAECEALRWACENSDAVANGNTVGVPRHLGKPERDAAWATLSDPARMAECLRAMFELRDAPIDDPMAWDQANGLGERGLWIAPWCREPHAWFITIERVPTLILALLAIERQAADARERTLRALEEDGR